MQTIAYNNSMLSTLAQFEKVWLHHEYKNTFHIVEDKVMITQA